MLFFPRCFDPVAFLFFATTLFFCLSFLFCMLFSLGTAISRLFFFFHSCFAYRSFTMFSFLSDCSMLFALFLFPFCLHFLYAFLLVPFYTRTLVLLYMFYNIFSCLLPFLSFFCFSSFFRMPGLLSFFCFLTSAKGFLSIYASPDIRTRSDRFVPSFPICFANDRLIPYRSDVSLLSFICHGCFIPIPPCFFLIDALVFFRLCRLSVAFLSAFSSCFGQGSLCLFFFCCTPCFCPFSVTVHLFWIISFGLSVFQQKKAHFCAFRLFYIVFQIAFAISLIPSLFWMACLSGFLFSRLSQPISLTGRTI